MSLADKYFKKNCREIINMGTDTRGEKVRPHWDDGTPAYTLKRFGVVNRYDLRKEFPAITLRHIGLRSAMDEILWIYQKKSNCVYDLSSHIWDDWADKDGLIGKAYGYQIAQKHICPDVTEEGLMNAFNCIISSSENKLGFCHDKRTNRLIALKGKDGLWSIDQMDKVIYDLINTPFSRRIMTNMWNPEDQYMMALAPCAYSVTYNVTEEDGKLILNAVLNQRSQDMLAANGWNTAQYAILLMMVAQTVGMIPGELVHVITDCHIYDRHVPMIEELLKREEHPAPKVSLNPNIKDFYQFTTDDLVVEGYEFGPQIKNIPVAV